MITSFQGDYEFLSNFYPCKIEYGELVFPSVENAYQAMKCANPNDMLQFVNISPGEAKRLGRKVTMVEGFDEIKYKVMRALLDQKFNDKNLRELLLATAPESIIEGNYWHDNYWGACHCDKCKDKIKHNHLGELLQRKRNLLSARPDTYTMYCGSIYHRESQIIIENPAVLYDENGYVLINIGNESWCQERYSAFMQSAVPDLFKGLKVFTFDNTLPKQQICELMNNIVSCTGYIERVVKGLPLSPII